MPDLIITARSPMPRVDSRRANFALAYGFRLVEVAGVDGPLSATTLQLAPQQIAAWIFQRE